jgi:hypothetical protein
MAGLIARSGALAVLAPLMLAATVQPSRAVPSFAAQTGQPCTACHVGAFGPQLTPLGRAFKIGGYTQTGGDGPLSKIPLAGFVLNSFTHTNAPQPQPAAPDFGRNNNVARFSARSPPRGRGSTRSGGQFALAAKMFAGGVVQWRVIHGGGLTLSERMMAR